MLSRRVGQRAVRYASSAATAASSSAPPATTKVEEHPHLLHVLGNRAISVRTTDSIVSPADALAIVRAIEHRFGRVAEFRFAKDSDPNRFRGTAQIAFADPATYARVPTAITRLRVKMPPANDIPESGGAGLADIAPYLDAQEWSGNDLPAEVDEEPPTDGSRIIEVNIQPSPNGFESINLPSVIAKNRTNIISTFVSWGGFAPLSPLPQSVEVTQSDLYCGEPKVDHPHMRNQLQVWNKWLYGPQGPPQTTNTSAVAPSSSVDTVKAAEPQTDVQEVQSEPPPETTQTSSFDSTDALPWLSAGPASPPPESSSPTASTSTPSPTTSASEPTPALESQNQPKTADPRPIKSQASVKTKPALVITPIPDVAIRRSEARAARSVVLKNLPKPPPMSKPKKTSPSPRPLERGPPGPPKPVAKVVSEEQEKAKAERAKAKKEKAAKETKAAEQPIEVEERKTGVAGRLKGLFGGWF
ncbi:hypothetical protein C8F04DRAFT_1086879 [Mycena alexandri]|uniref:Uncharacterized protein n=1 Tax=Mycena alexandri TaxID=1745969 RepID=A0AAD6T3G2_9AGAR|nr:hypothetical protein C8F04DRAFT_1086879 [Mycena alexandri]